MGLNDVSFAAIDEMFEYFTRCFLNAQPDSEAQERFGTYMETLGKLQELRPVGVKKKGSKWHATGCCNVSVGPADRYCPLCGKGIDWHEVH